MSENQKGELFLVATPIGNLEDMTFRAIRILQEADLIIAEDTRTSKKLLNHFEIEKNMLSYHQHNLAKREAPLLQELAAGRKIALICDAGTPGISDPGAELAQKAIESGFKVTVIPGASALLVALTASGLDTTRFCFEGFLPRKNSSRKKILEDLAKEERTMIFYESPHRLTDVLECMLGSFGERKMTVCRELTKFYEEYVRGSIAECLAYFQTHDPKGEFVLVVEGAVAEKREYSPVELAEMMLDLIEEGISRKEASKILAKNTGLAARDLYALTLTEHN